MDTIWPRPWDSSPREPRRYITVEQVEREIRSKGKYLLPDSESPKYFKRRLREDYDLRTQSQRVEGGYLLTPVVPMKKRPRSGKGRMIQGFIGGGWSRSEDDLMIVLRRGPTFLPERQLWLLRHLGNSSYTTEAFGNGMIVTLTHKDPIL